MVREGDEEWSHAFGVVRRRLPEFPEDWMRPAAMATPNPSYRTPKGEPGPEARQEEAAIREMGAIVDEEIRTRLLSAGMRSFDQVDLEVLGLERELGFIDEAVASRWPALEGEAQDALTGGRGPVDDEERLHAAILAYVPDAHRGVAASEMEILLARRQTISAALAEHRAAKAKTHKAWAIAYRDAMRVVLAAQREMGTGTKAHAFVTAEPVDPSIVEGLDYVAEFLPRDWIETVNNRGSWSVVEAARAWMVPDQLLVGVAGSTNRFGPSVHRAGAAHQLGHMASLVLPQLRRASWAFLSRRTIVDGRMMPLEALEATARQGAYGPGEAYRDGGFVHPYIGACDERMHPLGTYQVLPVGLQGLLCGWPDLTPDPDHLHFVLGLLSAA